MGEGHVTGFDWHDFTASTAADCFKNVSMFSSLRDFYKSTRALCGGFGIVAWQ
jgi:hypothetical protein